MTEFMLTAGKTKNNCLRIVGLYLTLQLLCFFCKAQFLPLKFDHITSENGLPHSTIHGIVKDKYGFMWFGTWSGLCRYDGYELRVYRYDPHQPKSLLNNRIHNIVRDKKGDLWISTFDEHHVCRYNYAHDNFDRVANADIPMDIAAKINRRDHRLQVNYRYQNTRWSLDNDKTALVETYLPTGQQKDFTVDSADPWSLNDAYVSDIFLDDDHVLWVGTYSNGINRSYLDATPFHYLYHHPERKNSLIENTIRSIAEDQQGNLWVGTRSKGITVVSPTGIYRHLTDAVGTKNTIRSNYVKRIFCDSKGFVWIGTQKGLDRYDPETDRVTAISIPTLVDIAVFSFTEDKQGNVWMATWNGLYKYDRKHDTFVHFASKGLLPHEHVWYIFYDSRGQIWAGTEGGGIAVLKENGVGGLHQVMQLQHQEADSTALSDSRIYSIYEDSRQQFWIGTGNGLDLYDPANGTIRHLSQQDDRWPKGTIAGITEDANGYIWVSHKKGISRINKTSLAIRTFSKQDGLQNNEFAEGAIFNSKRSNRLYFGGNKGVSFFSPDSIHTNKQAPSVRLTTLRILNQKVEVNQVVHDRVVLEKPLYLTSTLALEHEDKSISIEFSALHYANPAGNKYAYMLVGFDKDWIYTDADKRVATYANLNAGNYLFRVKAANSDGVWNETPTELQVVVAPAIWASTAAYVVYTLLFLALLYLFYYYSVRYARLKSKMAYEAILYKKEKELHERKVQFFTHISHEIKTPLSLILSPIQQLKSWSKGNSKMEEQLRTMDKNGNRLLKTVNQLLDIRRFETGHERLHLEQLDIKVLVHKVLDSFVSAARQKRIRLKATFLAVPDLVWGDTDKLEKILYNLLSNAWKFTNAGGMIKVKVGSLPNAVFIDVIDNGTGISAEDLERIFKPFLQGKTTVPGGTGLGLTYSKSLIEMHGGTLMAESRTNTERFRLTVFRVLLPKEAYSSPAERVSVHEDQVTEQQQDEISVTQTTAPDTTAMLLPRTCTLLLVEDNEEMRAYLADFFRKDYVVLQAANGHDGLHMARKHIPDLILSDVMMPKVDGIAFTRQVKTDLLLRHIPVILLTARTLLEFEVEGLETGADDYLVKPFHLPILALKVRNLLLGLFRMQDRFKQLIEAEPATTDLRSPDENLLAKVMAYVEEHIADPELKIDVICQSIGVSRAQLYRKMKALTGYSMADLIREVRLKHAQKLLREGKFNVSEVAYMVGFTDPEYFRKSFKHKFGDPPSVYRPS